MDSSQYIWPRCFPNFSQGYDLRESGDLRIYFSSEVSFILINCKTVLFLDRSSWLDVFIIITVVCRIGLTSYIALACYIIISDYLCYAYFLDSEVDKHVILIIEYYNC